MKKDLAELLAAEAAEAEHHADAEDHGPSYRRRHPPRDPAQVYSLRIPAAQLEQLRQLAADRNVTPSALMRQWVLERVAAEQACRTLSSCGSASVNFSPVSNAQIAFLAGWHHLSLSR